MARVVAQAGLEEEARPPLLDAILALSRAHAVELRAPEPARGADEENAVGMILDHLDAICIAVRETPGRVRRSGQRNVVVACRGRRAKVLGRVCMNMCVVDVSDIPGVKPEDEVVLLGHQGRDRISAEEAAGRLDTINYEVVTRINPSLPRRLIR